MGRGRRCSGPQIKGTDPGAILVFKIPDSENYCVASPRSVSRKRSHVHRILTLLNRYRRTRPIIEETDGKLLRAVLSAVIFQ